MERGRVFLSSDPRLYITLHKQRGIETLTTEKLLRSLKRHARLQEVPTIGLFECFASPHVFRAEKKCFVEKFSQPPFMNDVGDVKKRRCLNHLPL